MRKLTLAFLMLGCFALLAGMIHLSAPVALQAQKTCDPKIEKCDTGIPARRATGRITCPTSTRHATTSTAGRARTCGPRSLAKAARQAAPVQGGRPQRLL